jgi:choline transport protein
MNYTSAAVGIIGAISAVTWIVDGRKNFTGPRIVLDGEERNGADLVNEVGIDEKRI